MASRSVTDIRGGKNPCELELTSSFDEELGEVVPIPILPPELKILLELTTHFDPSQNGVFPAELPLLKSPSGP